MQKTPQNLRELAAWLHRLWLQGGEHAALAGRFRDAVEDVTHERGLLLDTLDDYHTRRLSAEAALEAIGDVLGVEVAHASGGRQ